MLHRSASPPGDGPVDGPPEPSAEPPLEVTGSGVASDYAAALLGSLGCAVVRAPGPPDPHPAIEWARCGAMHLTGPEEGPPRLAPGPLASCARGVLRAVRMLAGGQASLDLDGAALLGERAALLGLGRHGTTSPGRSCRLLHARDRWIALSLARPDDVELLPAWLGEGRFDDPWRFVEERVAGREAEPLVERARLLGLPAAVAVAPDVAPPPWLRIAADGPRAPSRPRPPLVVDLSSLWAGPLCTHLLALAGARVLKVESVRRPDGARFGPKRLYDLLNAGKESVALDFGTEQGRERLRRLVERADIVVEGSRPRALAQLGVDAPSLVERTTGLVWVSLTGYGRRDPGAGWVAFGDDAAVAAGLAVATGGDGPPLFCGDAIADPLTGLHAAAAALGSWSRGGGTLLDLSLRDVTAHVLAFGSPTSEAVVRRDDGGWEVCVGSERARVAPPRARPASGHARGLGTDTEAVLEELAIRC